MTYTTRLYEAEQDYDMIKLWWQTRGHWIIPKRSLPPTGSIVEDLEGNMLAAGWLYITTTDFSFISWLVTKPGLKPHIAHKSIQSVIGSLEILARQAGVNVLFSTSGSRGLSKSMLRLGYAKERRPHDLMLKGVRTLTGV